MVGFGSPEDFAMKTALMLALLLSSPQAPAVQTLAEAEPPERTEGIVLDPLAEAIPAHHCNVSYTQCPSGYPASCTGHTTCISGTGWVECDGVRTYCSTPCFKVCMDGYTTCSGQTSCSGSGVHWISCDGEVYECGPPMG